MPRLIEIVLFLTPLLGFVAWRLLAPSPRPPSWLVYGLLASATLLLATLLTVWHLDAADADRPYQPDTLLNGRVVTAPGSPP